MLDLGTRQTLLGAELPRPSRINIDKPVMPTHKDSESLVVEYNQGLGAKLGLVEGQEDLEALCRAYNQGMALRMEFFVGDDIGTITIL